jgi:membrane fusion protein (multidrug efflux system)
MAQESQSKAELSIALANHKRNQDLASQNFISARTVDESAAALEVAQAKLALAKATAARYKIIAPFDGITGIRTVNPGDYLKDGADIVNIEDIDAVYVDFRLPERFMTKIKRGQSANVDLDALPGRKFTAIVQAIDPLIDANGRSVGIRACIDNRQMQLRPGMFARVTTVFGERERALVIPEEAIVPQGAKVFVFKVVDGAEPGTKVSQRVEVKVGIRRPGRVEVVDGLVESDVIIVGGQQRVQKDGTQVKMVDFSKAPTPGAAATGTATATATATVSAVPVKPVALPTGKPSAVAASGPNPCLAELGNASGVSGGPRPAAGSRSASKS